ncbi:TonB C-terminal domain-containing protein [bacterium]|nr:TonB C-terminal domain-containing protein [bacterium]MBU1994646.1 TonB C-terminal domain-containing protein [bacterium]
MVRNNFIFFTSGLISLSLFVLFLALFIYMMFSRDEINQYALKKDNYISISLDSPIVETKISEINPTVQKEEIIESVEAPVEPAAVNIDDLFSDVWTKSIKKEKIKEKVDNKRLQEIQKKIPTKKSNEVTEISKKVNNLDNIEISDKNNIASSADKVNEYFANIQALVYKHFYPPQNSQGHSVKAVIELSSIGKVLDFRILSYSGNSSLNEESDKIKDRLMSAIFPVNPQNKSGSYTVILTSKE